MGSQRIEEALQVVSRFVNGEYYEMLWDGTNSSLAVGSTNGTISVVPSIIIKIGNKDVRIEPLQVENGSPIATGTVLLPSEPAPYTDKQTLVNDIRSFIHRYWEIDSVTELISSCFVLHTWLYDLFSSTIYWRWHGDYGTGKSRGQQTVGSICYRPIFVAGSVGAAPLFRLVAGYGGTLVIDEADNLHPEALKVLLCGYRKGTPVVRCDGDNYEPRSYEVYGPKLLTTRKRFPDIALESRCFTIQSQKCTRGDIVVDLPLKFWDEARLIRNKCLMYRFDHLNDIYVTNYSNSNLEPRLQEISVGLRAVIAQDDPNILIQLDTKLLEMQDQLRQDGAVSIEGHVVQAILDAKGSGGQLNMENLARLATNRLGYPVSAQRVGRIVRSLGLDVCKTHGRFSLRKDLKNLGKIHELRKRYSL